MGQFTGRITLGRRIGAALSALILAFAFAGPAAAQKVALVIGNSQYQKLDKLKNPQRDGELIEKALVTAGFDVVTAPHYDLTYDGMTAVLDDFRTKASGAEVALIYFAGHGVQLDGKNWFAAVDSPVNKTKADIASGWIGMFDFLDVLSGASGLQVLILDACRTDPSLSQASQAVAASKAAATGLATIQPRNALVVYSAEANSAAYDGDAYSPFALAFSSRVTQPGVKVFELFSQVKGDVVRATSGRGPPQTPFQYGGPHDGQPVYLYEGTVKDKIDLLEEEAWTKADRIGTKAAYDAYLRDYKDGRHKVEAVDKGEAVIWARATSAGTKEAYDAYLKENPNGRHWVEAGELGDAYVWNKHTRAGDVAGYAAYLAEAPIGRHWPEARQHIVAAQLEQMRQLPEVAETITVVPPKRGDHFPAALWDIRERDFPNGLRIIVKPGRYDYLELPKSGKFIIEGPPAGSPPAIVAKSFSARGETSVWISDVTFDGGMSVGNGAQAVMQRINISASGNNGQVYVYQKPVTAGEAAVARQTRLAFLDGQISTSGEFSSGMSISSADVVIANSTVAMTGGKSSMNNLLSLNPDGQLSVYDSVLKTDSLIFRIGASSIALFMRNRFEIAATVKDIKYIELTSGAQVTQGGRVAIESSIFRMPKTFKAANAYLAPLGPATFAEHDNRIEPY